MPHPVKLNEHLKKLFSKTKLVCFGRYALELPDEAQPIWGPASITDDIDTISGGREAGQKKIAKNVDEIKRKDSTAEFTYNQLGPVSDSWQLRYFESDEDKKYNIHIIQTYINKGDLTFILGGSVGHVDTEEIAVEKQSNLAKGLRLRSADEIPKDPGYCIEHAFIADNLYAGQETISIGFYFPSFPDISFSIHSNKDAYGDYSPEKFEQSVRKSLSLLERIEQAKKDQGADYPSRNVLREGKRDVQHWHGEESLIKREDGTHDFEWAFVGTPTDVANPSEFNTVMYSKVKNNMLGGADIASVSDDEAVALWDRLLAGFKFRVKVPRSPSGSYYFPQPYQN